ncbi:head GIN domain-containing protein [uncultured Hymenobacter sp.]|uniref:head GIN domain-containing protein n=1 Tax=uncultured Hymenobacter sp. TaxID=170016 RepID=UPI0035CA6344
MATSLLARLLTTTAVAGLTFGAAQAQQKQDRPLTSDFQMVESSGGIDVYLTQGPTAAVTVESTADALPRVVTEVKNGTLAVHWEEGFQPWKVANRPYRARVYVTAPRLTGVSVSGGADVHGQTTIQADDFRIQTSGGGDVFLTLQAKTLRAEASGGSDLNLSGKVERQEVSVSGGSDYHGFGLQSATASIQASGGSDADAWVEGELEASASGGSDLRYKGKGRVTSVHSGGSSGVRHVE